MEGHSCSPLKTSLFFIVALWWLWPWLFSMTGYTGTIDYRETHLEAEVKDLRRTVDDQEKRLSTQQNEIAIMHRLLGEAQLQINYLQTEVTFTSAGQMN